MRRPKQSRKRRVMTGRPRAGWTTWPTSTRAKPDMPKQPMLRGGRLRWWKRSSRLAPAATIQSRSWRCWNSMSEGSMRPVSQSRRYRFARAPQPSARPQIRLNFASWRQCVSGLGLYQASLTSILYRCFIGPTEKFAFSQVGAPGRNRTCCLSVRSRTLCPVSYRRASASV